MRNFLNRIKRHFVFILFCFALSLIYTGKVYSDKPKAIVQTSYTDIYTLGQSRDVKVFREIRLKKKTDQLVIVEYQMQIASMSLLNDLTIYEDQQKINYDIVNINGHPQIRIVFVKPLTEINQTKNLKLEYVLKNYLNYSGLSRELFIPLNRASELEEIVAYEAKVTTPVGYPPYGFSKPRVSEINSGEYKWIDLMNTQSRMLYLSLSDKAYYRVSLKYTLMNNSSERRIINIPLIPDGIIQKIYIEKLIPEPEKVYLDEDANFLAQYTLEPNSVLPIQLQTYVELSTQPRTEVKNYWQKKFRSSIKNRYLTLENYWSLNPENLTSAGKTNLKTAGDIYHFVADKLNYDNSRLNSSLKRMGANWAFSNPEKAVCAEYTDLFIALARENGISAREVVGYAVTTDQSYLPLSFLGDVLHAWPERYDTARETWLPLDPTWGDTSGLDYYGSFDLSHISFVYHGKDPNFPLPPGVYKIDPKVKDVSVIGTDEKPPTRTKFTIQNNGKIYYLVSETNYFLYNQNLSIKDGNDIVVLKKNIPVIEPFSQTKLAFPKSSRSLISGDDHYRVFLNDSFVGEITFKTESIVGIYALPVLLMGILFVSLVWFKWH